MIPEDAIDAALIIGDLLDSLGIDYAVGGSVASSFHGFLRATHDVDLVAGIREEHVAPLLQSLGDRFYADEAAIRRALRHASSFNLIHLGSMTTIDVFVAKETELVRQQLLRRRRMLVRSEPDRFLHFVSAEDIVLQKLAWFRRGGGVSGQQWRDVLGVLKVQGARLDGDYLREMASRTGLVELLDRALAESRLT